MHRRPNARGVVGAVHPFQDGVVERLGAEAHPVDAGGAPCSGVLGGDIFGVGFERDLDIGTGCVVRGAWEKLREQQGNGSGGKQ